ncbi:hypothetical protein F5148DRAFT_80210 [Russula earlei]|uniref:Uncharacterized protein n=1 Tax=Russula earlei TaxID=71964 RepID=A0ACC0U941_9AGAM|nr:hypothetical protein F5148DRAFT_80210 [Russula earlei]
MGSSDAATNVGFTGMVLPPFEAVMQQSTMSDFLSTPQSGNTQSSQETPPNVVPVDLSFGGVSSGDPGMALHPIVLGYSSCSATLSDVEAETSAHLHDASGNAERFLTHDDTDPAQNMSSNTTTSIPSLDPSDITDVPLADPLIHVNSRKSSVCDYSLSQAHSAETLEPTLDPTLGAPTPLPPAYNLARDSSSPSSPARTCYDFLHLTPPSSPWTDCNITIVESRAGIGESSSNYTTSHEDPPRAMSSPNFSFHEDASSPSSSAPHQTTTSTKRGQVDESDEDLSSVKPAKRIRMDETMSSPLRGAPAPWRATLASQKLSRKKLVAPFRSPLQTKTPRTQPTMSTSPEEVAGERIVGEQREKYKTVPTNAHEPPTGAQRIVKSLVRSSRAATQFRSPLVKAPIHESRPLVLPNQVIMNLERTITTLKRAIKIKRDSDEYHLERLAKKWRDAGREAAYELWGIVRDLSTDGGEIHGKCIDTGWGWDYQGEGGTCGQDAEGDGYTKQESTLGVMLRNLGIAPETLGWNDEEETFVDDDEAGTVSY